VQTHDRIAGLDGLRAIAIALVILWHSATACGFPPQAMGWLRPLVMNGWAGVDLFFALSGFLITTLLLREETTTGHISLGNFYARRALRILPPFLFVLALNMLLLGRANRLFQSVLLPSVIGRPLVATLSFAAFFSNYYLAYVKYFNPGDAFFVYWSLCVEEHFYLLWPTFLRLVRSTTARTTAALAACGAVLLLRWIVAAEDADSPFAIHNVSHYRLDSIIWGAIAALQIDRLRRHVLARRVGLAVAAAGTVVLMARHDLSVIPRATPLGQGPGFTFLAVTCTLVVAEVALTPASALTRVLESRLLRSVGQVSYGMYLVQFQAIDVGKLLLFAQKREASPLQLFIGYVLFISLTFAAASLLYRGVERPFLQLKRRFYVAVQALAS
jgi:peptidoglycan/LPS O-acetylase OafA/YrhL